jgi:hypothetical protein
MIYEIEGVDEDGARSVPSGRRQALGHHHFRDPDGALMELKNSREVGRRAEGPLVELQQGELRSPHAEGYRPARQDPRSRRVRREIARVNTLLGAKK